MKNNYIDISAKITNQLPSVKITDDIIVTVNNRKTNIINMQAMIREAERKAENSGDEYDEIKFMDKALELLIGQKNTEAINELDLPFYEYKAVYNAILGMATGDYDDEEESPSGPRPV